MCGLEMESRAIRVRPPAHSPWRKWQEILRPPMNFGRQEGEERAWVVCGIAEIAQIAANGGIQTCPPSISFAFNAAGILNGRPRA